MQAYFGLSDNKEYNKETGAWSVSTLLEHEDDHNSKRDIIYGGNGRNIETEEISGREAHYRV